MAQIKDVNQGVMEGNVALGYAVNAFTAAEQDREGFDTQVADFRQKVQELLGHSVFRLLAGRENTFVGLLDDASREIGRGLDRYEGQASGTGEGSELAQAVQYAAQANHDMTVGSHAVRPHVAMLESALLSVQSQLLNAGRRAGDVLLYSTQIGSLAEAVAAQVTLAKAHGESYAEGSAGQI